VVKAGKPVIFADRARGNFVFEPRAVLTLPMKSGSRFRYPDRVEIPLHLSRRFVREFIVPMEAAQSTKSSDKPRSAPSSGSFLRQMRSVIAPQRADHGDGGANMLCGGVADFHRCVTCEPSGTAYSLRVHLPCS